MEFTNEIFFNKNLTANETVIITYAGKLYSEHSEYVTIVYGYGNDWKETTNAPMKEIENGFEIAIDIKDYDTFNFCFKNNFDIWDNNYGFNYISPILPKKVIENDETSENIEAQTQVQEEITVENSSRELELKNETDEAETTTDSTLQSPEQNNSELEQEPKNNDDKPKPSMDTSSDISIPSSTSNEENETSEIEEELENETETTLDSSNSSDNENSKSTENFVQTSKENIENIFNTLLDSILEDTKGETLEVNPENLEGFGLQSVDEIKEENINTQDMDNILNAIINESSEPDKETINTEETKFVSPTKPIYQAISELNKDYEEIKQISDEEIETEAQNIVSRITCFKNRKKLY